MKRGFTRPDTRAGRVKKDQSGANTPEHHPFTHSLASSPHSIHNVLNRDSRGAHEEGKRAISNEYQSLEFSLTPKDIELHD